MSLIDRLTQKRSEIYEKLLRIDRRIVRNGGSSMFKQLKKTSIDEEPPAQSEEEILKDLGAE